MDKIVWLDLTAKKSLQPTSFANHVLETKSGIIILDGKSGCGKTRAIRKRVPELLNALGNSYEEIIYKE